MHLVGIQPEQAAAVWPLAHDWIAAALKRDGRFKPADVLAKVEASTAQLWVVWGEGRAWAAVVTEVCDTPLRRDLNIWLCGGTERKRWVRVVIDELERFAMSIGCAGLMLTGRSGWVRDLADFVRVAVVLRKDLG